MRHAPMIGWIQVLLVMMLAGCSEPQLPIRIGTILWPGYEYLHLADHLDYFEEEGVRVQLVEFVSLTDARRAFERGQIDAWGTTAVELLQSIGKDRHNTQAFYILDYSNGADVIVAHQGRLGVFDLGGRRVAAEPGTLDVVMLSMALKLYGMSLDDVELVSMPQHRIPQAFLAGEVDAVVSYPPNVYEILREGEAHIVFDSSEVPGLIVDVLAADSAFIDTHADELAAIIRANDRAQAYAREHPAEAIAWMSRREALTPEEFKEAVAGMATVPLAQQITCFEPGGRLDQAFAVVRDSLLDVGMIDRLPPSRPPYTDRIVNLAQER